MNDKAETGIKSPKIIFKIGERVISAKEAVEAILSWAREDLNQFFLACEGKENLIKDSTIGLELKTVGERDVSHASMRGIRSILEDYSGKETTDKK